MDWSKAKTILIVAFIITNILLVNVLIGEKTIEEPTIKEEFIEDVVKLLASKNISLATDIPKKIPHLNTMIVKYEKINLRELNRRFFKNLGIIDTNEEDLGKIVKGEESILVFNKKLILYENKDKVKLFTNLNEDKAIEIAEDFLKERQFDNSDMKLTFIKEEDGVFYLEYSKVYEDIFVERAFTNFQIDNRGVKRFERLWLVNEELGDTEIYISTAPKAILELLSMGEVYGKTITDISICYYFDPQKHNYLEELGEAKQGKAVPAWRVQFSDGYKLFIDDY
ncbi:MAG: hypothetical protein GX981_00585 [Tissierellia bacterium]|nr:hypothetical protein [Tissierellia bacterium]